jgi:hypothetical protein
MHASIACLLLYEDYVWVSLGNAMKAKQSKAKQLASYTGNRALHCWCLLATAGMPLAQEGIIFMYRQYRTRTRTKQVPEARTTSPAPHTGPTTVNNSYNTGRNLNRQRAHTRDIHLLPRASLQAPRRHWHRPIHTRPSLACSHNLSLRCS